MFTAKLIEWEDDLARFDDPPFLITLGFDPTSFDRLDELRRRYFPAERNQVPAHLSMFHQLPGSESDAIDDELARVARSHPPIVMQFTNPKPTGHGVMLAVQAPGLAGLRGELAKTFARHLTPQDRQPYQPHVMIMNKADRVEAERALLEVRSTWSPWSGIGDRLILWRYLGGPWDEAASYPFSGPTGADVS